MKKEKSYIDNERFVPDPDEGEFWFSSLAADDSHVYDVNKAYAAFQSRMRAHRRSFRLWPITYGAAAILLLLLISVSSYWFGKHQIRDQFADIVVEAPLGAKTRLVLPDSTLVWLNAGSRIMYSQGFGVNDRLLELTGEAYFEVRRNEHKPFEVKTKEMSVVVLGTKFNFRNYMEDEEAIVNLVEGKVRLENRMKQMAPCYLSPSEKVTLNKVTGEMMIVRMKSDDAMEWTSDRLFFDEVPLADIVRELNRSYNVRIRIMDRCLERHRFYAVFDKKEQTIYDVLNIMKETNQLTYKEVGNSILLYAK